MSRRLAALWMVAWAAGCSASGGDAPGTSASAPAPASAGAGDEIASGLLPSGQAFFAGRVVPTDPLLLHAPPNVFKVSGWASTSDSIQIVEVAEDGAKVKKGDVVARFAFRGDAALPRIEQRIREAQASLERVRTAEDEKLRDLRHAADQARITAERATVETQRQSALSAREAKRIEIDARLARFEAEAAARRVAAQTQRRAAEVGFEERIVALRQVDRHVFDDYKDRFLTRAPADGFMQHAWLSRRKRRVEKGDDLQGGTHFASLARDERLSVRFYLPEHRRAEVAPGRAVRARAVASTVDVAAHVVRVEPFPQPLGFLEDDWELTSALEKFFVVVADFDTPPPFPAGVEAEVRF